MNAAPLLTLLSLLGVTLLARTQALDCQWGVLQAVRNVSELPLEWTAGQKSCEQGEGCQDTVILIVNGPLVNLVISKGCTMAEDQEARITRHRAGPGLSITSYTRVCRHGDFCNDLSTSARLWDLPPETVPGTVRCPLCLSKQGCPENAPQQLCPAGHEHCYRGVLQLRGAGIASNLRVQGCMPEPGCNLLNGTQEIGPVDVSERCAPESDTQALDCQWGALQAVRNVSELPLHWTVQWQSCEQGEGCQDTVILIVNGPLVNLVLSKGCTMAEDQEARITRHRAGPGLSITSYTRVCRHGDFCNDLSTSARLWDLPPETVPGTVRCPLCLSKQGCPENAPQQLCPAGHEHCYRGVLQLRGAGIASNLRVQGCMPEPGCNLLNGTQEIGPVDVSERCAPESDTLICYRGSMIKLGQSHQEPSQWTTPGTQTCRAGELCQETLLLINAGHKSLLVGSKGCSQAGARTSQDVSTHTAQPGLLVASYARFCAADLCNQASDTSVLVDALPPPAVPPLGDLQCPTCVELFGSCRLSNLVTCPKGTTQCYKGYLALDGGGVFTTVNVWGCPSSPNSLLNSTGNIGIFSVREITSRPPLLSGAAPAISLAWAVGLGLSLAPWGWSLCPPANSISL